MNDQIMMAILLQSKVQTRFPSCRKSQDNDQELKQESTRQYLAIMLVPRQWNRWSATALSLTFLTVVVMVWIFTADDTSGSLVPGSSGPMSNIMPGEDRLVHHVMYLRNDDRRSALEPQPFTPMSFSTSGNVSYDVGEVLDQMNEDRVKQDHPDLIQVIRDNFIFQPSTEEYNLDSPDKLEYSNGQAPFIDSRLNYMVSVG